MKARTNNRSLYTLLGIVFVLAMGYQVWFSFSAIQYRRQYAVEAGWPFGLNFDSNRFSYTSLALKALGVQVGDELIEIEGHPYEGMAQVARVLTGKRPGDQLTINVLRKGHKEPEAFSVLLPPPRGWGALSVRAWIIFSAIPRLTHASCRRL